MADTEDPNKTLFKKGGSGGPGRRPKRFTEDVEHFAYDALNIKGVRMMVDCMTTAMKPGTDFPDWKARTEAFKELRDTFIGKPAQIIMNEDGSPLFGGKAELIDAITGLAGPEEAK